ncbi:MAG TPA: hypothetical protein VFW40_13480 [Capsulimonadaceae bacterium]|nr:hypothetical protein [Capsulimonadaceae bacterium]
MKSQLPVYTTTALIFSVILCHAGSAAAQSVPAPAVATANPSAPVPLSEWPYQATYILSRDGFPIQDLKGRWIGSQRVTRADFAAGVARVIWFLDPAKPSDTELSKAASALQDELGTNQQALDAFKSLVDEFSPELAELGSDAAGAKAQLNALEQRLAVVEAEQRRVKIFDDTQFIPRPPSTTSTDTAPLHKKWIPGRNHGDAASAHWRPSCTSPPRSCSCYRRPSLAKQSR